MEHQQKHICIIGLGWLGEPLAKHLKHLGYSVSGTCTTEEKRNRLCAQGIAAEVCLFPEHQLPIVTYELADVAIVCIPPSQLKAYYTSVMRTLSEQLKTVSKVIFVSSTSVYADANMEIDESTATHPQTDAGKILAYCEAFFLNQHQYVVRLSGLYGEGRHPGKWFAGKENIPNGLAPVNMISLSNCIQLFIMLIQQNIPNPIINGVESHHPTRMDFYTQKTQELGLPLPHFIPDLQAWKRVNSKYFNF